VGTSIPEEFDLSLNLPNPFNPATEVRYQIPEVSNIRLSICDVLAREVAVLVDEMKPPAHTKRHEMRPGCQAESTSAE